MLGHEPLKATVQTLNGQRAVLAFETSDTHTEATQQVTVPRGSLPEAVIEGDSVVIEILTDEAAADHRDKTARKLLEDILNGH